MPLVGYVDQELDEVSPTLLVAVTATTVAVACKIFQRYHYHCWGKSLRERVGLTALQIPYFRRRYDEMLIAQHEKTQDEMQRKWAPYYPLTVSLPEKGLSFKKLYEELDRYVTLNFEHHRGRYHSGTVYLKNSRERQPLLIIGADKEGNIVEPDFSSNDKEYFQQLAIALENLYTSVSKELYWCNSLHIDDFILGLVAEYQAIRIFASTFGGKPDEVKGFITSGGTESLMLMARGYRNWGRTTKDHGLGDSIIIAPDTIHAGVLKASELDVKVVLVPTDDAGCVKAEDMEKAVKKYGKNVVAIFASAPNYCTGKIDPIEDLAKIAEENEIGFHVDACLGFPVIHYLGHKTDYLALKGVTSVSGDNHKFGGYTGKGVASVATKDLPSKSKRKTNLASYVSHACPNWSGGIYGSPKDNGSRPCGPSMDALFGLVANGKAGFERAGKLLHKCAQEVATIFEKFEGKIELIARPDVHVVPFRIDRSWGLKPGATYVFLEEMKKRNFSLNSIANDAGHFCVTPSFAADPEALSLFEKAVKESLKSLEKINAKCVKDGVNFPGNAGTYCKLNTAEAPDLKDGVVPYLENLWLGRNMANDMVHGYFSAVADPYVKQQKDNDTKKTN